MGVIAGAFTSWLRDFITDGLPASGANPPSKASGRAIGSLIEQATLDAVGAIAAGTGAWERCIDIVATGAAVTSGAGKYKFRLANPKKLTGVYGSLDGASSSGAVQVDVNLAGTSVLSSVLQIDQGAESSDSSAAPVAILTADLPAFTEIELDVDAAGTGATGLKVVLLGYGTDFGESITPFFVSTNATAWGDPTEGGSFSAIPMPAGFAAGDILIVQAFYWRGGDPTTGPAPTLDFNRPSGWSTLVNPIDQGSMRSAWFWKRADGTETSLSLTLDDTLSGFVFAAIHAFRGCVANGQPWEALALNAGDSIGAVAAGETILTSGPNRLAVTFFSGVGNGASSPDAGWTQSSAPFGDTGFEFIDTEIAAAAGSYGPDLRTMATGTLYPPSWASVSLALLPS